MKPLPLLFALGCAASAWAAPLLSPAVQIETARASAPINPQVYGQFIEHLGRCIYGGIWAEMLEDRKFHFPVTAQYAPYKGLTDTPFPVVGASPWQIVGDAAGVTMETTDVFVGAHTPALRPETGLSQHDLGVVAGRSYTGYFWAHSTGANSEVDVSLVTGTAEGERVTVRVPVAGGDYSRHAFSFTARSTTDHASLEIVVHGSGLRLGTVSLMPADNIRGMRRDTLQLLKELNSPVYRWPGGNFTSGYNWRDGIGDRDRRPPRTNPAWTGVEHNDFGTDEFLDFCRELGTTPMIAANTGFGDAYSAAQWVEYCNGSAKTLAGGWRAANGHAEPYGVRHWCVGNEMFGPWQLGFMQLQHYTLKHNQVATAMHEVDPSLILVGVGAIDTINKGYDPDQVKRGVTWSEGMLEACADQMNFISEHVYDGRLPWEPQKGRPALIQHVSLLRQAIRHVAERHREVQARLPNLQGRRIPVSLDEWNYWHREYVFGELGCRYDLADALGVAAGLHEIFRQSDVIQMAHYAQTVNVIGAIKTSRTAAQMETTGLVLAMYRAHFGSVPVAITGGTEPLDFSAALSPDGHTLTVAVINPTTDAYQVPLAITGRRLSGTGASWTIAGQDEKSFNNPGEPRAIDIVRTASIDPAQPLSVQPLSCTVFSFTIN